MKIYLWGVSTTANKEDLKILKKLESEFSFFSFAEKNKKDVNKLIESNLFFKHDSLPKDFNKESHHIRIDTRGGNVPHIKHDNIEKTFQISWSSFITNLRVFLCAVESTNNITLSEIEVLFNYDSKLENLLKPFSQLSPCAKSDDPVPNGKNNLTAGEAHKKLMDYIN